jgi:uncharacterized protein (DUF1501 family)
MRPLVISRRSFVRSASGLVFGAAAGPIGFFGSARADRQAELAPRAKVVVCVFLRGAVDGLSLVVPYTERAYYDERDAIAVSPPGKGKLAAIRLDRRFALHPKLGSLFPLYREGELAVVHAVGCHHPTRSHFEAQDNMESGVPGENHRRDGWVSRSLSLLDPLTPTPLSAIALSNALPLSLRGPAPALVIPRLKTFGLRGGASRRRQLERGFRALYASADDPVTLAGKEALDLLSRIESRLEPDYRPANGAEYPKTGEAFSDLARLIKADLGVQFAWIDLGGWDTHFNQGGAEGQLANKLEQLGNSLAALRRDLGRRMGDVVVVTLSEFGRTIAQNGTRGTDHGHGTALLLFGGKVKGGRVFGTWPGLEPDRRFEGRDLAVTTDFRDVLAEVLVRHAGLKDVGSAFPGYAPPSAFLGLLS